MAHQAQALPWQATADHFKFSYKNLGYHDRTNLYPCFKPGQGKQLQRFAKVFARLMDSASAKERKKYPETLTPPKEDEVFIPDSTVKRIATTVKWYKTIWPEDKLSDVERKLPYWRDSFEALIRVQPRREIRQTMDLLRTLIMYGEMLPLLRLATHPDIRLPTMDPYPTGSFEDFGWTDIKNSALIAYVCLNMFFTKPELYNPASRSQKLAEMEEKLGLVYTEEMFDYRNTSSYQKMLTRVTLTRVNSDFGVCALPHRQFFGIDKDMVTTQYANQSLGVGPPAQLLNAKYRSWYVPIASDVSTVYSILYTLVPAQVAFQILNSADYKAKRTTPVPHDPLHADNAKVLKGYLAYCWNVLVRIDMLVKAGGKWIDWEYEVTEVIYHLWGVAHPKMMSLAFSESQHGRGAEDEIDPYRTRMRFV
jgi:hypothetical protein